MDDVAATPRAFDPLAPEFLADPYPVYRSLREADPVHWNEAIGAWICTRHADCTAVLRDDRFSADRTRSDNFKQLDLTRDVPRSMLSADPPDHTRLRTLVNKAFTARTVERLRPRIHEITDRLLDEASEKGRIDVIADLAYPLPITVIAEMLGVPSSDRDTFRDRSSAIALSLGPLTPPEVQERAIAARDELVAYFSEVLERRRNDPGEDLITALLQAEEEGDVLSLGELLAMLLLLLIAGHETTVNLIGNGLYALLRHPDQMQRMREDPSLVRSGVEELLRFDSPVQLTGRVANEELDLAGRRVRPRQSVITLLAAANRDPEVFADPDRLDLARAPNPHLSFGAGIHFCLGAPLARLEGGIALTSLIRRFPGIGLAGEAPAYRPAIVLRGLERLPVTLG